MKQRYQALLLILVLFLAGCGSSNTINADDLAAYEVKQTFDEIIEDDFIFRLVSEKEVYEEGEKVNLFGEIVYTGTEEEIVISHAAMAVYFTLHEQVRDYFISSAIQEIGKQTVLTVNAPYRVTYNKESVFSMEEDPKGYQAFIEDFKAREDFPPGYYVVGGVASFFDGTVSREIKAEVDFKVR